MSRSPSPMVNFFAVAYGHNGHFLQHNWYISWEFLKSIIIGGKKSIIDSSLDWRDGEEGSLETHSAGKKSCHHSARVFSTCQTAFPKHSSWIRWDWLTICISGCQMGRGDGSPPNTQRSSFWCGWGQSSRYFQQDREMFPNLSKQQHQCYSSDQFNNWTGGMLISHWMNML